MEDQQDSFEELKKIRGLMERSSIYHSLSGLSGMVAGVIGIIAYAIVYFLVNPLMEQFPQMLNSDALRIYLLKVFFAASIISLVLAFSAIFYFNWRNGLKNGISFYDAPMQKMFINLFIPLIAGGIFCLMLVREQLYLMIAPSMLIFYGLAMIQASRHTIIEIRHLGLAELALGLIAIFFQEYGMWFWLAGFGFVNLFYGAFIYLKYERA